MRIEELLRDLKKAEEELGPSTYVGFYLVSSQEKGEEGLQFCRITKVITLEHEGRIYILGEANR